MEEILLSFSRSTGIFAFMHSPWGWPIAESIHFLGLSLLIGTVGLFDLRLLGLGQGISYQYLHRLVPFGVLGYSLNVITGTMFLSSAPDQYLYNPAFQTKMLLMAIAGINMLLFYSFANRQVQTTQADVSVTLSAKTVALVSLCCWCGVIIGGRLITYFRPPYHWCFWC
ncbi:MAG: hypothetical protein MI746_03645 [Pseudomonadales bacterium]|nr:hypothetical protein [Pseudomonadales bacterium]